MIDCPRDGASAPHSPSDPYQPLREFLDDALPEQETAPAPEISYTIWPNRSGSSKHDVAHSWRELCEGVWNELPSTEKDRCRLIKLATFGDIRTGKGSLRHDANVLEVTGLEGDHDAGTMTPLEAIERLERHGLRALVYTSWSHRPESPRWRVLAPLSRPVKPADRLPLVEALNGLLDGALARESATLSQSFYIGRRVGAELWVRHTFDNADEGICLDELDTWQQHRRPLGTSGTDHDTPPNKTQSAALADLLAGDDVHGNALKLVGRMVREGLSDDVINTVFAGLARQVGDVRGPDRAACLTGPELQRMIDGARKKGYRTEHAQRPSGHTGKASDPPRVQAVEPASDDWPEPSDIRNPTPAAPYPTECFPQIARQAIEECAAYRRVPAVMPAQSALFQMSLATQGLANVARDSRLVGPISTNTLLFLESGGRKTAVDGDFGNGYKLWVRAMRKEKKDEHDRSVDKVAAYESERKGILSDIKGCAGKADEKSRAELDRLKDELFELTKNRPTVIPLPADLVEEFNRAALSNILAKGWPSTGTTSDEAGILIGSQGFAKENATGMLALFNRLWDGADYIEARKTVDAAHIRGRRFCCHLAMQPNLLDTLVERGARDIGFLARFLIARPDGVKGDRLYQEPPERWEAMQKFDAAIMHLLGMELPIDREGEDAGTEMRLKPPAMRLSADAKRGWIDYHDDVERELCKFGEYEAVSDVASKSAENAARIAAIFQIFDNGGTAAEVEAGYMESAISVAHWHLYEARRLFLDIDTPENQLDARELSSWLCGHARTLQRRDGQPLIDQRGMVPIVDILHSGPNRVRTTLRRDAALDILIEAGHVRRCDIGKKRLIEINPKLLNQKR